MSAQNSDVTRKKRINRAHPIAATLCIILFVLIGCGPSVETVERTTDQTKLAKLAMEANDLVVRRAAVEKLTDQAVLAKLAVEDKDSDVCHAAAEKLTDQALLAKMGMWVKPEMTRQVTDQAVLAKIAEEAKDREVRRAAAEKLTDQALLAKMGMWVKPELTRQLTDQAVLAKVAQQAEDRDVRLAAAEKLTDRAVLARVAVYDRDPVVCRAAHEKLTVLAKAEDRDSRVRLATVKMLTDQDLLAKVAVGDEGSDVRGAAVRRLTDQTLLAKVAVHAKDSDVCHAAAEKLTDQSLLAKLAAGAKWLDIRVAAIGKVTDQALLRQWAEKDPQAAIRQAAAARITDDSFLIQRLPAEPSAAVRAAIIETLHEKDSLRRVALTAYHQENRKQALQRLQKALQDPAADVVIAHKALESRVKALAGENDAGRLLALALESEFDVMRAAAARRLTDPASLEQACLRVTDRDVLKILLAKLEDNAMLNRIAAGAADPPIRLAAARKSGTKSWVQIFDAATAKGATVQMLGDALSAVSLFLVVQQDAAAATQEACLNLVRRGDESRIPEMVELLTGYGDKTLAEDYLNCGQPDLDAAGREWAQRRGYSIGVGAGSHRATWGSGR